jgi:hypothetical protein
MATIAVSLSNFKHKYNTMKDLLITSNKTETIINIASFIIGCTLIATLCAALIYGLLNGSL